MSVRKNIRVTITQEDIDAGVRLSSSECAGALAIDRAIEDPLIVDIRLLAGDTATGGVVYANQLVDDGETVGKLRKLVYWAITPRFSKWIKAFDRGEQVKPLVTIIRGI